MKKRTKIILLAAIVVIILTISCYAYIYRGLNGDKELTGKVPLETDKVEPVDNEDKQVEKPEDQEPLVKADLFASTPIMGQTEATAEQMIKYLMINNPDITIDYAKDFVSTIVEEAQIEGVRADLAFALMIKETDFLKFSSGVGAEQNNFGSLVDPKSELELASFDSMTLGIRATIQHLVAYSSEQPLKQDCVDPAFDLVTRGSAKSIEKLAGKWSKPGYDQDRYEEFALAFYNNDTYGQQLVTSIEEIKTIEDELYFTSLRGILIDEGEYVGLDYLVEVDGDSLNGMMCKYLLKDPSSEETVVLKDYCEETSYTFVPDKPGKFELVVQVKDKNSDSEYDEFSSKEIEVKQVPPAKLVSFKVSEGKYIGTNYKISARGDSVNGVVYKYLLKDLDTGKVSLLRDYSEKSSYTYVPKKVGSYQVQVHIRDKKSNEEYEVKESKDIKVRDLPPAKLTSFTVYQAGYVGSDYAISAKGDSVNGVVYRYLLKDLSTGKLTLLRDYSEKSSYTYLPQKEGSYQIQIQIRDKKSKNDYDVTDSKDIVVKPKKEDPIREGDSPLKNKTIMLDPGHGGVQPGAVNGVPEKVINNSLTKIIAAKLEALGANVIYTRHPDNDIDMSLEDRQEKANRIMPDLLLSIHHDAPRYGFSVHYSTYRPNLEFDGAYFDLYGKRYYVIREEGTVQYYMDKGVLKSFDIKDKGAPYVRDLSPSPAAVASEVIADKIFEEFKRLNDLLDDLGLKVAEPYIRDHNLAMTRRTNMPSVLIEAGPTSAKMNNKSVQNKIADGVIKAIESYFSGK